MFHTRGSQLIFKEGHIFVMGNLRGPYNLTTWACLSQLLEANSKNCITMLATLYSEIWITRTAGDDQKSLSCDKFEL